MCRVPWEHRPFDSVAAALAGAMDAERGLLREAIAAHCHTERLFEAEQRWVRYFLAQETPPEAPEVVELDVGGERVCAKRSTLMLCERSALARRFDASV